MGKASRKMKKKQQQEAEAGLQAEVKTTEQKLFRQIEEEAYSEALDTLVELVQKKSVSPQAMYAGAYAYFMMGDYDRAANWIDNTLRYAPNHVAARILLARLCILQDKADAGLAIFDLLTDKFLPALKEEERDEIESLAGFYGRNEPDKVKREYPHLAAFLQIDKENHEAEEKAEVRENAAESRVESVGGLKLPSISKAPASNENADGASKSQAQQSGKSALDVLRTLKAKIDARAHGNEAVKPSESEAASGVEADRTAPKAESVGASEEARRKIDEICGGKYTVAEKVRLLNSFAGGYYAQGDLDGAELCLKEALRFDEKDGSLLRNIAVLLAEKGEKDKALQAAAQMQPADFLLLRVIREM
jgi:tetratricopeptide (TPR) repeat protein